MRALHAVREDTCPGCGQPKSEAWIIEADKNNKQGTHWYDVPPPTRCHACNEQEIAQAVEREYPRALHYGTLRRDR